MEKVLERSANLQLGLKKIFRRFDKQDSGMLEKSELIRTLVAYLPGISEEETAGLARRYDYSKSGTYEIGELCAAMDRTYNSGGFEEEEAPPPPQAWGTEEIRPPPARDTYRDSFTRRNATGANDDDGASESSFPQAAAIRALDHGDQTERLYRFQSKLRDRLYTICSEKYLHIKGPKRLFKDKETLIKEIAMSEVSKAFNREKLTDNEDEPGVMRADFETFRRVLHKYRTPGQPFCTAGDLKEMWALCDSGNYKLFLEVLYAPESDEPQEGASARSRRRAQAEAPTLKYHATSSMVMPPTGWDQDKRAMMRRSASVPDQALNLEWVYGYNTEANGPNLYTTAEPGVVVFVVAAVVVILTLGVDEQEKSQRFFLGHSDDIVALAVDSSGTLAATGQVASIGDSGAMIPFVLVWDLETLETLRRIDSVVTSGTLLRSVAGLCFSSDSSMLVVISVDDKHTLGVFDLVSDPPTLVGEEGAQNGAPTMVQVCSLAPPMVAASFCVKQCWVTVGKSSHIKFWLLDPTAAEPLRSVKGKHGDIEPPKNITSIGFVDGDDITLTGGDNGAMYTWRLGECTMWQQLHRPDSSILVTTWDKVNSMLWTAGSDSDLKCWSVKDYECTLIKTFDLSVEGAGRMTIAPTEVIAGDNQSVRSGATGKSGRSGKSGASGKSGKSGKSGATGKSGKSKGTARSSGGSGKNKANLIRKQKELEKGVWIKDVLILEPGVMLVATDAGSFWFIDDPAERCEEIYFYHGGSPIADETYYGGVHGVAPHPSKNCVFASAGEDKLLAVWDASHRRRISTGRLQEIARCVAWSPDGNHLAVGFVGGFLGVYDSRSMLRVAWHHRAGETISVLKYSPNGRQLATGSHENHIDLYDVRQNYHFRKRLMGHSSYVMKLDWSEDSKLIVSNCGAYEILYWDAIKGVCVRASRDSTESDTLWHTFTCVLGFPVMGIWESGWDRTDVNTVSTSGDKRLVVLGDDFGDVHLMNNPCIIQHAPRRAYSGHSSHVADITFLLDDQRVISAGGHDKALFQFRVEHDPYSAGAAQSDVSTRPGESVKPPPPNPKRAWKEFGV